MTGLLDQDAIAAIPVIAPPRPGYSDVACPALANPAAACITNQSAPSDQQEYRRNID
ncbi:hypothetical protein [Bradyrhizobium sp.]|uniref:hypothetical protein n=1 Tax=Bradyrhizobium sp. TaxID=376 RepID=UPI003D11BB68